MDRDTDSLTPLKDIIAGVLEDGTLPFNPEDGAIWNVWAEVVGPVLSRNTRPSWIREGVLRIVVSNSIWLQELRFAEEELRERLNTRLGRQAVSKIQFRVGPGME
jgi:predicted nucleic acid-binding Zn ribbon protein